MKYYEIWFYYYGENDERTDFTKEYTWYFKSEKNIKNKEDLIAELKENSPMIQELKIFGKHLNGIHFNYIQEEDYEHLSKWFEISSEEFSNGCGISIINQTTKLKLEKIQIGFELINRAVGYLGYFPRDNKNSEMLLDIINGSKPDDKNTTNDYYCETFEYDYETENNQMYWYIQNFFNKYGLKKELSCEPYEDTILNSIEKLTMGLELSIEGLEHLKKEFETNVELRTILNSTLEYDEDSYESPFARLGGISILLENFKNFAFSYLKDVMIQLNRENHLPFQDIYKKN